MTLIRPEEERTKRNKGAEAWENHQPCWIIIALIESIKIHEDKKKGMRKKIK